MRFSDKKKRTSANCGRLQEEHDKHREGHFLWMEHIETVRTNAAASQGSCRKGQRGALQKTRLFLLLSPAGGATSAFVPVWHGPAARLWGLAEEQHF